MAELIAVVGATGFQGGSVIRTLSASPEKYRIRGISRNIESARVKELQALYPNIEWVAADLDDPATLEKAFAGADIVFGNTNYFQPSIRERIDAGDYDAEFTQGKNMVDAAVAQGVKHIVYSPIVSAIEVSNGKYTNAYDTEGKAKLRKYIEDSPIDGYFIYCGFYFQNSLRAARWEGEKVIFEYPLPIDVKQPYVDIDDDYGNIVELMLSDRAKYKEKRLAAVEGYYTGPEIAAAFARATGIEAEYRCVQEYYYSIPDIKSLFEFFIEFDALSGVDMSEAKNNIKKPFTNVDQFWTKHKDFRP
ncbi:hypothetical protein GGI15_004147 [Coemansia interrupta]|uniref:NmrA-like domain-containing protein n=1 Tax=Coemansia interrupta TaxID=1126814 RepID=A0A9W8HAI3_9FUNG|nr:hypothetical protein GGI15_004147 [Coemansia interrupta]